MIWALGIGLVLAIGLFLAAPFLSASVNAETDSELQAYREELRALSGEGETPTKSAIEARLLTAARQSSPDQGKASIKTPLIITAFMLVGTIGIYSFVGAPNFTPTTPQVAQTQAPDIDFDALIPQLEARLKDTPEDSLGWTLYGRTLMLAGRPDESLRAYERAMGLSDDPAIIQEYESAKDFAERAPKNPSQEEIAAMQNLSEADQQAAINDMVESLRARLEAEPNNPAGWTRLLRSRQVLGQTEAYQADVSALRAALPEQADAIIAAAKPTP